MLIGFASEIQVDSDRIAKFYADNWARPVMLSNNRFYNWQFQSPPCNQGHDHCVVAYDDKLDAVAGVMGLNERTFYLDGKPLRGAELTTWIVSEQYRAVGAGAKILKKITDEFDVLIGMGISEAALPVYLRSGFRYMRQIPRFVKIINFAAVEAYCTVDPIGQRLVTTWNKPTVGAYRASPLSPAAVTAAFDTAKGNCNLFSRLPQDLQWRYTDHPYFKYHHFAVSAGDGHGEVIVAFRVHEVKEGFKVLHLMDMFGDASSIDAARSFIEEYAVNHQIDVIDFYCTASGVYRHLIANHWYSTSDDYYFKFPHLFSPVEMRDPPTTSLIYWAKSELAGLADIARLYITKQDADLDRPTPYDFPD
jgi:hypothetical protein